MGKIKQWMTHEEAAQRLGFGKRLARSVQLLVNSGKIEQNAEGLVNGYDVEVLARQKKDAEKEL